MKATILNPKLGEISTFDELDGKELKELIRSGAHKNKKRVIPDKKFKPNSLGKALEGVFHRGSEQNPVHRRQPAGSRLDEEKAGYGLCPF